ncbi:hypothetical protein Tco_1254005 [Tanacetum coccineum]
MIDYAVWEVIENGATLPKTTTVEGVVTEMPITTAEEKAQRRLEEAKKLLEMLKRIWSRNKADLETMSMDDLYKNLKVYDPEVKGMSSSSLSTQNMAFVSSLNNNTSITNEAVNTANGVSTASTQQVNAANSININNLSDSIICAFFSSQPNCPQLVHEDLQQIHLDDMEEMDLRCSKVRVPTIATKGDILLGSAELQKSRKTGIRKALRRKSEEGPNYALMAFSSSNSDSKVSNDSICLKYCLKTIESLKS